MATALRVPRHDVPARASTAPVTPSSRAVGPVVALGTAAMLVLGSFLAGDRILAAGIRLQQGLPPFTGTFDWRPGASAVPAVLCGGVVVLAMPALLARARWGMALVVTGAVALGWSVALALVDGTAGLTGPLRSPQYATTARSIVDLHDFLRRFTERIGDYNIHTRGHPPGMVVVSWALERVGLGSMGFTAALVLTGGAIGVVVALVAAKEVAGEVTARRAAPFVALAPAAIWWSSGDALFSAVALGAVAATVVATGRSGRRSDVAAGIGGALFAATAYLSYGLVLLAVVPLTVATFRRRLRPIAVATATAGVLVVAVTALSGFRWWDGLAATRHWYFAGVASRRPYEYYVFADLAVLVLMVGPAALVGLARLRRAGPAAVLVGGALAAVVLADLSGMSKAEVERIWIPFVPLLACAAGLVAVTRRATRAWLVAQVTLTLVVAVGIRSPW